MRKAIFIVGPTASGKSALAVEVALRLHSEIISADSMQIYRKLDIGTAKSTNKEMKGVIHHGINLVDIWDAFNVTDFQKYALEKIDDCNQREIVPVITGGTGLYIQSLLYDLDFGNTSPATLPDADSPTDELYRRLQFLDPERAQNIHPNNRRRIIRALEIAKANTGKTTENRFRSPREDMDAAIYGLIVPRELLLQRIEERVDKMLELGLLEECKEVLLPWRTAFQAAAAIGYAESIHYWKGMLTRSELRNNIIVHTRQYAKRQMTWFRRMESVHWLPTADKKVDELATIIAKDNSHEQFDKTDA